MHASSPALAGSRSDAGSAKADSWTDNKVKDTSGTTRPPRQSSNFKATEIRLEEDDGATRFTIGQQAPHSRPVNRDSAPRSPSKSEQSFERGSKSAARDSWSRSGGTGDRRERRDGGSSGYKERTLPSSFSGKQASDRRSGAGRDSRAGDWSADHGEAPTCVAPTTAGFLSSTKLSSFGLPAGVVDNLAQLGIVYASETQVAALPAALAGEDTVVGAETGSGKTLIYSLPIAQAVAKAAATGKGSSGDSIRAIVLVPSQELAVQVATVLSVLEPLTRPLPVFAGSHARVYDPAAVLVATPGGLERWIKQDAAKAKSRLASVRILAVDEGDVTLSASHLPAVESVLAALQEATAAAAVPAGAEPDKLAATAPDRYEYRLPALQFIVVSATLVEPGGGKAQPSLGSAAATSSFGAWLHRHLRHATFVRTSGLHHLTPGVRINDLVIDTDLLHARAQAVAAAKKAAEAEAARPGRRGRSQRRSPSSSSATAAAQLAEATPEVPPPSEEEVAEALSSLIDAAKSAAVLKAIRLTLPADRATQSASAPGLPAVPGAAAAADPTADAASALPYVSQRDGVVAPTFEAASGETVVRFKLDLSAGSPDAAFAAAGADEEEEREAQAPAAPGPQEQQQQSTDNEDYSAAARHGQVLVFANNFAGAEDLSLQLEAVAPDLRVAALHKSIPADIRARIVDAFLDEQLDVVVATDLAARGLDTLNVTHVINYDVPNDVVSYIHRAGRTARAGGTGMVTDIVLSSQEQQYRALAARAAAGLQDAVTTRRNAASKARRLSTGKPRAP